MSGNQVLIKYSDDVVIEVDPTSIPGLTINFIEDGNKVLIEEGSVFHNTQFKLGRNSSISIAKTHKRGVRSVVVDMAGSDGNSLEIGAGTSIESARFAMANEHNQKITIGENCMLSSNIVFRSTDGHVIFSEGSKKILNRTKAIEIGNHVWIGSGAVILKGAVVLDECIIGTKAVVAKKFKKSKIVLVGNPAKIVKEDIGWERTYIKDWDGK